MDDRLAGDRTVEGVNVLDFDSDWFGKKIGRCDLPPEEADLWAKSADLDCLFTLLPLDQIAEAYWATNNGFRLVDVRVEFAAGPTLVIPEVRQAAPRDAKRIAEIAKIAFQRTRFHNDRRFDPERVNEMYANWALTSKGLTFVSEEEDVIAGFVVVGDTNLELIAVDPLYRGNGHGDALAKAAVGFAFANGRRELKVVTQGGNQAAQKTFQAAGFRLVSTSLWFHKWYS